MNKTILAFASLLFLLPSCSRNSSESDLFKDKYDLDKRIQSFNDIHLEMSLKPFKVNNRDSIDQVCRNVFIQWMQVEASASIRTKTVRLQQQNFTTERPDPFPCRM